MCIRDRSFRRHVLSLGRYPEGDRAMETLAGAHGRATSQHRRRQQRRPRRPAAASVTIAAEDQASRGRTAGERRPDGGRTGDGAAGEELKLLLVTGYLLFVTSND